MITDLRKDITIKQPHLPVKQNTSGKESFQIATYYMPTLYQYDFSAVIWLGTKVAWRRVSFGNNIRSLLCDW